jgi:four helix bundle protein
MGLGHEKLDVYRLAIDYVAWVYQTAGALNGIHRHARDQWLRASQSIPLNIAEGNGKASRDDRRRYFEIARASALECAAIQDVLVVGKALETTTSQEHKIALDRIAAMLSRLGGRGYCVGETHAVYIASHGNVKNDSDSDPDSDLLYNA